jgi:hypothetical protein
VLALVEHPVSGDRREAPAERGLSIPEAG